MIEFYWIATELQQHLDYHRKPKEFIIINIVTLNIK